MERRRQHKPLFSIRALAAYEQGHPQGIQAIVATEDIRCEPVYIGGWRSVQISTIGLGCSSDELLAGVARFAPAHVVLQNYQRPAPVAKTSDSAAGSDDPDYWLRHPPGGARVEWYNGRRVVTLTDGRVVAELLTGRGRWFASAEEFRKFIRE